MTMAGASVLFIYIVYIYGTSVVCVLSLMSDLRKMLQNTVSPASSLGARCDRLLSLV